MREYRPGRKPRIHHDARTRPLFGRDYSPDTSEQGRYYRCWNCGFMCDTERDDLGGMDARAGDGHEFFYEVYPEAEGTNRTIVTNLGVERNGVNSGVARAKMCLRKAHRIGMLLSIDGITPEPIVLTYASKVIGGCPFCGTRNYRGDIK